MRRAIGLVVRAIGWAVLLLVVLLVNAWPVWAAPPLPAGERLALKTQPPHLLPNIGCPAALLLPVRMTTSGTVVEFVDETGDVRDVQWPTGWAAWRIDETAFLLDQHLKVVAREGELIGGMGGGMGGGSYHDDPGSDAETFHVCAMFN
jgi:hypothetical protein